MRVDPRSCSASAAIGLGFFALGGLMTLIGVGVRANWLSRLAASEPGSLGRIFESGPVPLVIFAIAVAGVVCLILGAWITIRQLLAL